MAWHFLPVPESLRRLEGLSPPHIERLCPPAGEPGQTPSSKREQGTRGLRKQRAGFLSLAFHGSCLEVETLRPPESKVAGGPSPGPEPQCSTAAARAVPCLGVRQATALQLPLGRRGFSPSPGALHEIPAAEPCVGSRPRSPARDPGRGARPLPLAAAPAPLGCLGRASHSQVSESPC